MDARPTPLHWRLRTRQLTFGKRPRVMGIVNVTPDSFSDGGQFLDTDRAVSHALALADAGADLLDIGGESTRPYAEPVPEAEELARVIPVIERVAVATKVPISVDTSKPVVARAAVEAGAEVINDVCGFRSPEMIQAAVDTQAGVCVMHMLGTPQTMQHDPQYQDVVRDVADYLARQRDALVLAGVAADRICLDPGIGFGKRQAHNLQLLERVCELHALHCPILIGHSRKGFLAKMLNDAQTPRLAATLGVSCALAAAGVQVLRVHDVLAHIQALQVFTAIYRPLP